MKYLNHNLLSRLGNLPLEARHSMTGNVSGRHRSASRGSSVEFAEYRKYVARRRYTPSGLESVCTVGQVLHQGI